jgi:hypothetical protein
LGLSQSIHTRTRTRTPNMHARVRPRPARATQECASNAPPTSPSTRTPSSWREGKHISVHTKMAHYAVTIWRYWLQQRRGRQIQRGIRAPCSMHATVAHPGPPPEEKKQACMTTSSAQCSTGTSNTRGPPLSPAALALVLDRSQDSLGAPVLRGRVLGADLTAMARRVRGHELLQRPLGLRAGGLARGRRMAPQRAHA